MLKWNSGILGSHSVHVCSVAQSCPTLRPHGLQPARLLCPWYSPGKNNGVRCNALLQGIFLTHGSNPSLPYSRQILYHGTAFEAMFSTSSKISSVMLQPIRLLMHLISKNLSRLSSFKSKSSAVSILQTKYQSLFHKSAT